MVNFGRVRSRKLPHIDVEDKPTFITGCLYGSISYAGMQQIRDYREELEQRIKPHDVSDTEWKSLKHRAMFKFIDELLDGQSPVNHFTNPQLAQVVVDAFLHFADVRYHLLAFVVMPSHHHWLFMPKAEWVEELGSSQSTKVEKVTPRQSISHSIQSYTAHQCNRVLGRTGTFWQDETYDHFARDDDEVLRIVNYIEQNPVKAGIVENAADYAWSSAHLRKKLNTPIGEGLSRTGF